MSAITRATVDGLHIVDRPGDLSPPRVVIVHGGMDRSSSFGRVVRRLGDVPVTVYDRRGYGRSAGAGTADLDGHLADLDEVVGHQAAVLVGHSVGGVLSLLYAQDHPERVAAVLAYEPPAPWFDWWPADPSPVDRSAVTAEDEAEAFMRRMVGDRIWDRLPARTRADRRAEGEALRADIDAIEVAGRRLDPGSIRPPVLAAAGGESGPWYRRGATALGQSVVNGRSVEVEGAGHGVHLSHPTAFADLIRRVRQLAIGVADS